MPYRSSFPRRAAVAACAVAAVAATLAPGADAVRLGERTFLLSQGVNGVTPDGASTRPSISADGRFAAFESTATNLALDGNGPIKDVFIRDVFGGQTAVVSEGIGGAADGPSGQAALAGNGRAVAFVSQATNLVPNDTNGQTDLFIRAGASPIARVSVSSAGGQANGFSRDPDISHDGRLVAFSSVASNLVAGDTNEAEDVFVRNVETGTTIRVSERSGVEANGISRAPSISSDGRFVSFYSKAPNLVTGDANGVGDVFLADLETGRLERVSVSSAGRQQNRSVGSAFVQVSDVSTNGRVVVFDSDATNLVPRDFNRDTDVFMRDRRRGRTTRISVNARGREGNNDSFWPVVSPNGRFVAFESFAGNLAPGDGRREDTFMFDSARRIPVLIGVGARGQRRGRETVRQLLQRPVMGGDGTLAAFSSTATNLVAEDDNRREDVFLRLMAPAQARWRNAPGPVESTSRPRYALGADDRANRAWVCAIDGRRFPCRRRGRLPALRRGRHTMTAIAVGPGMLPSGRVIKRRFLVR